MTTAPVSGPRVGEGRSEYAVGVLAAAGVGAVVASAAAWSVARSDVLVNARSEPFWLWAIVVWQIAVGAYACWRRPTSRLGPLIIGLGFLYASVALAGSSTPLVHTLGMTAWTAAVVSTVYVYLCFPRGRLESPLERRFIRSLALGAAVVWGLILALSPVLPTGSSFVDCGARCPANPMQIIDVQPAVTAGLRTALQILFVFGAIGATVLLLQKVRSSSRVGRRALMPLAIVFALRTVSFSIVLLVLPAHPHASATLLVVNGIVLLLIPSAILIGQVRGDVFAAMSLGRIAMEATATPLTSASVEKVIADAVGDSTLRLALWDPTLGVHVDVDGDPVELPGDPDRRAVTHVIQNGRRVAALIHDTSLDTEPDVVQGLAVTSLMLLENSRLVEELRASRTRLVETAESERRRLERDLHDGAQQSLVAIDLRLESAREHADSAALERQLARIQRDAQAALSQLRALAHGIYPAELRELGPAAALRALARTSVIPIRVRDSGFERVSDATEAAIYFCAREAIQNAAKHAGAGAAVTVTLGREEGMITAVVTDDGVGMPDRRIGESEGITGMRDRIEAVGGQLEIVSASGRGTSVRAMIPDRPARPGEGRPVTLPPRETGNGSSAPGASPREAAFGAVGRTAGR